MNQEEQGRGNNQSLQCSIPFAHVAEGRKREANKDRSATAYKKKGQEDGEREGEKGHSISFQAAILESPPNSLLGWGCRLFLSAYHARPRRWMHETINAKFLHKASE